MRTSIRTQLLLLYGVLVVLATVGLSGAYYLLSRQDKQQESQQRIQVAFDVILHDMAKRVDTYKTRFDEFLRQNVTILGAAYSYTFDDSEWGTIKWIYTYFQPVADELTTFGRVALADRVILYGANKRLLVVYRRIDDQEPVGGYLEAEGEGNVYLDMEDPNLQSEIYRRGLEAHGNYFFKPRKLPETPLPPGVNAYYERDLPETNTIGLFERDGQPGLQIAATIYRRDTKMGVLLGEVFYTQALLAEYAALTNTEVNLLIDNHFRLGTLPEHTTLDPAIITGIATCDDVAAHRHPLRIIPLVIGEGRYHQGQCVFNYQQGAPGILTVSLSQALERQAMQRMLMVVLTISASMLGLAIAIFFIISRRPIRFIQQLIVAINRIAMGDLPQQITEEQKGEFHDIKQNLNLLIETMHTLTLSAKEIARGNLTITLTERSEQDELLHALQDMLVKLRDIAIQVKSAADNVAARSQQMRVSADHLLHGATQQTQVAEDVFAALKDMSAITRQNAEDAWETGKSVTQTMTAMHEIATKIRMIEDIAGETNLLSLNATIEAARAQDHGKTFAVVATEIRNLAENARMAATEINAVAISSVATAQTSDDLLAKLVVNIEKTAALIQEICEVSDRGSAAAQHNTALQRLNEVTQQHAASADEMAAMAEELAIQADQLQQIVAFFRIEQAQPD